MVDSDSVRFEPDALEAFAAALLGGAGLERPHRAVVAEALVRADLRGVDSHGVARLEPYVEHLEAGGFNTDPDVTVSERGPGAIVVDADDGPGQVAGKLAMERLTDVAAETGVGVGVVHDSNHFGTAAYYTEYAAENDCIGVATTNVPAQVIPFGGREPYLGTNPVSVSVPTRREFPITMDMATSIVAMGKVDHVAAEQDTTLPEGWAVDEDGEPTTDPHAVHALRPFGGAKGYCLGVVVDLLSGVLAGANQSTAVSSLYGDFEESMGAGHFFLAIDVATLRDLDDFYAAVDHFAEGLKAVRPESGTEEVLLPGELEARAMRENRARGVPVNPNVFDKLREIAAGYDVEPPAPVA